MKSPMSGNNELRKWFVFVLKPSELPEAVNPSQIIMWFADLELYDVDNNNATKNNSSSLQVIFIHIFYSFASLFSQWANCVVPMC